LAAITSALAKALPGDRVVLRAGEYRLSAPLKFPRGGKPRKPITLCGAPGDYVALLGSVRLTGWRRHAGKIWKIPHPPKHIKGLYEDGERLTHPRPFWGKREDPPLAELRAPGTWTQDRDWVYLWTREGDSPDNHRIEASQHVVVAVDKPWARVVGLRMFFGQHIVCVIRADNCEVADCEIAHCSNSVDNSYCAYFSGCANSAYRRCVIHDSFYWGDHGSNSHLVSCIDCGFRGPNFVEDCEIFNGGLGVGTKGAVRQMVVTRCRIYDVVNGVVIPGPRVSGPGAGKTDCGHYLVYRNLLWRCSRGVWLRRGDTRDNRIWNNVFRDCGAAIAMRNVKGEPRDTHIANNVFLHCTQAVLVVGGRDGSPTIGRFIAAGLRSHNNLFHANTVAWRNPLTWTRNLDLTPQAVRRRFGLEKGSLVADPRLNPNGFAKPDSPTLGAGAPLDLPDFLAKGEGAPAAWHIGLGPAADQPPGEGLALSIAGSQTEVGPGQEVKLRARLVNPSRTKPVELPPGSDAIVTFHFRYLAGHFDKQELYRVRVRLPETTLRPGASLDLSTLPGWKNPVSGKLGDPFHLRTDTKDWARGCRLRATIRFVPRGAPTAKALQSLAPLIRSDEILSVRLLAGGRGGPG